eukprot:758442-Hanusia_phi.AAC.3
MGGVEFWRAVVNVTVRGDAGKSALVFNSRQGGFEVDEAKELAFSQKHPVGSEHDCFISGKGADERISFSLTQAMHDKSFSLVRLVRADLFASAKDKQRVGEEIKNACFHDRLAFYVA